MKKILYLIPVLSLLVIQSVSALYIGIGGEPEFGSNRGDYRDRDYRDRNFRNEEPEYVDYEYMENIDGW